ncbi:dolichyl-diphosphooligosaccharide--protein glycosyltransferase subunit 1-like isoform X1 [Apostichopus japonicus]|uniref:dolichyl-diphosphooligosaccharide--protein glycosyltransferase subunit 1-like isoform X1 n=1 Tax=Stichopus japonicus TaxID=307972 RepID=UPI003AB61243
MKKLLFAFVVLTTLYSSCLSENKVTIKPGLVNKKVERKVDISSQLVQISTSVTVENTGSSAADSYVFGLDPVMEDTLAFAGASQTEDEEEDSEKVSLAPVKITGQSGSFFEIKFQEPLKAGSSADIKFEEVYIKALRPYPAQITQSEKQLVEFFGSVLVYSPYKSTSQTTTVKLASSEIESHTKVNPVSVEDDTITYGPYEDKEAFSKEQAKIHFENNKPFLTVTRMERVIEVSHWGNIAVEETFDVSHSGAKLKGSFSRYDYQRQQDGFSSVKSFTTILPAAAQDVYYRDEIGNISTSNLLERDDHVELELRPRFPLFGGWKTHYTMGYNLPSYEYLFSSGDNYILKMRFLDHVFDDMVVDDLTVKIILPEGCKNARLDAPFDVRRDPDELHKTYLDISGRIVLIAHKSNLVEQHIDDFELHYTFSRVLLLQEPLMVVVAFFLVFLVIIVTVRLDFAITKDAANESRLRLAGKVEEILSLQGKRQRLYPNYDTAINKFKSNKDNGAFRSALKALDAEHRNFTSRITDLMSSMKAESTDVADKVNEAQKIAAQVKDLIQAAITNAEKVVNGKLSKQQYVDYEKTNSARRSEYLGKIDQIFSSL